MQRTFLSVKMAGSGVMVFAAALKISGLAAWLGSAPALSMHIQNSDSIILMLTVNLTPSTAAVASLVPAWAMLASQVSVSGGLCSVRPVPPSVPVTTLREARVLIVVRLSVAPLVSLRRRAERSTWRNPPLEGVRWCSSWIFL